MIRIRLSLNCNCLALVLASLLCLLTSACTDDSYTGNTPHSDYDDIPLPVNVFVGKPDSMQTKSSDAVLSGANVYIYAFRNSSETDFRITSLQDSKSCLVDGSADSSGVTGGKQAFVSDINACAEWTGSFNPLYPMGNMKNVPYNFFAYYIDTLKLDDTKIHRSEDDVVLDVDLDGKMDIMTSKSTYSGEKEDSVQVYSYISAIKGIVPIFTFHHRLAKLSFVAVPGTSSTSLPKTITIQKVIVMSAFKAKLTVAYKDDREHSDLVIDESSIDSLALTEADGSELLKDTYIVNVPPEGEVQPLKIGGSMLVAPSETYKAYILLKEENLQGTYEAYSAVDLEFQDGFEANCSYQITLKLFGNMIIEAAVQLVPWNYGGDINIIDYDKPE